MLRKRHRRVMKAGSRIRELDAEGLHDLRKQLAKWSKANRAQSREWIPAMIAIEPDAARRVALNAFSGAFEKVWGYPLNAAATRDDALALAQRLLDEPARRAVAANG